jgi:hypothetical protein
MASSRYTVAYHNVLRELSKAVCGLVANLDVSSIDIFIQSPTPRSTNKTLSASFRAMFEKYRGAKDRKHFDRDVHNAITFMRSQREYKASYRLQLPSMCLLTCASTSRGYWNDTTPSLI